MVDIQQYNMVVDKRDFYATIQHDLCMDEYAIGMHGIGQNRHHCDMPPEEAAKNILKEGLKIHDSRTIHGTVNFLGNNCAYEHERELWDEVGEYTYAGSEYQVIVAIPTWFRSEEDWLFLGTPNKEGK